MRRTGLEHLGHRFVGDVLLDFPRTPSFPEQAYFYIHPQPEMILRMARMFLQNSLCPSHLSYQHPRQVVATIGDCGVVWTEYLLMDCQRASVQWLGLGVLALCIAIRCVCMSESNAECESLVNHATTAGFTSLLTLQNHTHAARRHRKRNRTVVL